MFFTLPRNQSIWVINLIILSRGCSALYLKVSGTRDTVIIHSLARDAPKHFSVFAGTKSGVRTEHELHSANLELCIYRTAIRITFL